MFGRENSRQGFARHYKNHNAAMRRRFAVVAQAAFVVACGFSRALSAATVTWDAGGAHFANPADGSGTWSTTVADWSNGTSDASWNNTNATDIAVFGNGGTAGTVTVGLPVSVGGMTFNSAAGGYNISGTTTNTITLTGTSGTADTITLNNGSAPTIFGGFFTGNGVGFTLAGSGTFVIGQTEAGNYTGYTTIGVGTILQLGNGSGTNGSISNGTGITDNGTLQINRSSTTAAVPLSITGTGGVIQMGGGGTTAFGGVNTYSGPTTVSAGTFSLAFATGNANPIASLSNTSIGVATGATFNEAATGSVLGTASITSSGTVTLSGLNTYSGATTINAGTFTLNGNVSGTAITVAPGATFAESAAGGLLGSSSLVVNSGFTMNGVNTNSGPTNIANGTLTVSATGNLSPNSLYTFGGGANNSAGLNVAARTTGVAMGGVNINPGVTVLTTNALGTGNNYSFGSLTHAVGGVLNFGTTVSGNNLLTTSTNANLTGGQATILNGWSFIPVTTGQIDINFLTVNPTNGTLSAYTAYTYLPGGSDLAANAGKDIAINGSTTALVVSGTTTVNSIKVNAAVGAGNTINISNPLTVATGGIIIGNVGGNANNFTGSGGGTLTSLTNDIDFLCNTNATTPVNISVPIVDNSNGPVGFTTAVQNGKIAFTLSGSNTFSGDTNINSVSTGNDTQLIVANTMALQNSTVNWNVGSGTGTSFLFFGTSGTPLSSAVLGGLKGNTNLNIQASAGYNTGAVTNVNLSIGNNNQSNTYAGALTSTGTGGITKVGTGTWTLSGANAISGPFNVSNGIVKLVGSGVLGTPSAITVASGAILDFSTANTSTMALTGSQSVGGAGTILGAMTLASGTQLSPAGLATLTTGNLNLASGVILNETFGSPGTPGSPGTSGLVYVNGNLILPSSGVVLNLASNGSLADGTYDILNFNSSSFTMSGFVGGQAGIGTFKVGTTALVGQVYTFSQAGSQIDLTVSAPPILTWTGAASGAWNTSTGNWANGTSATAYSDPDAVTFGDNSALAGNPLITNSTITIQTGGLVPANILFTANSVNYTFQNTGSDTVGINGSTGLTMNGSGTVSLTSPNSFTGPIAINAGLLNVSNANALGKIGPVSGITVANGAALQLQGNISIPTAQPLTLNGSYSGTVGALHNLAGSNSYIGPITLASPASITSAAGTLTLTGGINTSTGNALTVSGNGNVTVSTGTITGGGSLTFNGGTAASTLTLPVGNTYSGGTTIGGGVLKIAADSSLGAVPSSPSSNNILFSNNATLQAGASGISLNAARGISINGGSTATFDTNGNSMTVSGSITGGGNLTKIGLGILTVAGSSNTYSGNTTITGGTLALTARPPAAPVAGAVVQIDASTLAAGTVSSVANLGNGGGTLNASGAIPTGSINGHTTLSFGNQLFLSGLNSLAGNTSTAVSVFIVSNAIDNHPLCLYNTVNGGPDYNTQGDLLLEGTTANGLTAYNHFADGGTNSGGDRNGVPIGYTGTNIYDTEINLTSGYNSSTNVITASNGLASLNSTFNTSAGGAGNFSGNMIVVGGRANAGTPSGTYNGQIGEVLVYQTALTSAQRSAIESYLTYKWMGIGGSTLPSSTSLSIASGSSFDLNGNNQQVATLTNVSGGGGTVTNSNAIPAVLTINQTGTDSFAGSIQDGASQMGLTLTGGGTQSLTGANTYSGPTTISAGKLIVTGSLGSTPITVASAATFAPQPGTGTITASSLNLSNGSTFDMTDGSIGIFNLSSSGLALQIGSALGNAATLNFDLSSTGADKIVTAGTAAVFGTNTVNITALGTQLSGGTYTLISATGGGLAGTFQFSNGLTTISDQVGSTAYNLSLVDTGTQENLVVQVPGLTDHWIGGFGNNWSTAGNWTPSVPGGTANPLDSAVFDGGSGSGTTVLSSGQTLLNITFDGGANSFNIGGSGLKLSTNGTTQVTSSAGSSQTISAPISLLGNYSFLSNSTNSATLTIGSLSYNASGASNLTLGGSNTGPNTVTGAITDTVNGALTLIKSGTGTWVLGASDSYTGGTNINAGILSISNGSLGTTGSLVFNGGTLQYAPTGATQDVSSRIQGGTGSISIDTNGNSVNFAGSLGSANVNGLTKLGAGTLTLLASNSYTGSTNLSAGALNIANSNALPAATTVTVAPGAALQLSGGATVASVPVNISGTGVATSGAIESLSGANTYGGPITLGADSTIGVDTGSLTVSGPVNGANTNLTLTGAGTGTISSSINTGTGALTVNSGTWALTGSNTYSGGSTLNGGITQVNSVNSLGAGSGTATINAATLEATATYTSYRSITLGSTASTIKVDSGQNLSLLGTVSGSGGVLNKTGPGTLTLGSANSYDTGTNVGQGVVVATSTGALGTGTVTLSGSSPTLRIAPSNVVSGFGGSNANNWTLNNGDGNNPTVSSSNVLTLTTRTNFENRSAFYDTPVAYNNFTASFVYQALPANQADGFTFTLQNNSPSALGGVGGNLGYVAGNVSPSASIGFDIYNNNGIGAGSGGTFSAFTPTTSGTSSAALLASGDPILITITGAANSSSMSVNLVDQASTGAFVGQTYSSTVSLTDTLGNLLGGPTAYVGFTGATGGLNMVQTISNFSYTPPALTTPFNMGNNIVVNSNSTIDASYAYGVNFGSLTINSSKLTLTNTQASGTALVTFAGLTNTGTLDITKDAVDIQNGNIGAINAQVGAAYHGGRWNGNSASGAITSSLAATDSTHLTAVGVATNLSTFEGQAVNPSDVLIKYTYYGDANLDGQVNSSDYTLIDAGFLSHGSLTGWQNGDFNYDNVINGSDYTLIDNAFNMQGAQISTQIASPTAQVAGGVSAVPEPTTLGLLGIGAMGLLSRRRRRSL